MNPDVLEGWGIAAVRLAVRRRRSSRRLLPRVSVEVSYNRRSWGNFYYTDNRAVGPARLRHGDAHRAAPRRSARRRRVSVLRSTSSRNNKFGAVRQLLHLRQGLRRRDLLLARPRLRRERAPDQRPRPSRAAPRTGRGVRDTCDVQAKLPEATLTVRASAPASSLVDACAVNEVWQTNFRGLASYTIPKIDVLVSAHHAVAGQRAADQTQDAVATNGLSLNAQLRRDVGAGAGGHRPAAAGRRPRRASTSCCRARCMGRGSTRSTSALRKVLRFGGTRTNVGLDLYNLFNANTGTAFNQGFGRMVRRGCGRRRS